MGSMLIYEGVPLLCPVVALWNFDVFHAIFFCCCFLFFMKRWELLGDWHPSFRLIFLRHLWRTVASQAKMTPVLPIHFSTSKKTIDSWGSFSNPMGKIKKPSIFANSNTLLETNSKFAPGNGWLEILFGVLLGFTLFSGANLLLVSGILYNCDHSFAVFCFSPPWFFFSSFHDLHLHCLGFAMALPGRFFFWRHFGHGGGKVGAWWHEKKPGMELGGWWFTRKKTGNKLYWKLTFIICSSICS